MKELTPEHNQAANSITGRMSLREPQRESLAILARLGELLDLDKGQDVAKALTMVKAEFPSVTSFERDFPSICFALATGVGKTRLMGAFIAYLHRVHGTRHFFVVAPNLTIYEKLRQDFTPGTPKYVFTGISDFAVTPPEIVTGDNYESGRATRRTTILQTGLSGELQVQINIFNISKINEKTGGQARIRRLNEVLGQSYFDYLAGLPDLVVLMDESHRYRAEAGMKSINELKPILGLELTATPHTEKGNKTIDFQNVIYDFPLAKALEKGFVKAPAVVGRENFKAEKFAGKDRALEELKLEDAAFMHERTKTALATYATNNSLPRVKPFVLVVAENTTHAGDLRKFLESDAFKGGQYKGKVIEVHSGLSGEEEDKMTRQLIEVEKSANPVEWVVHVNKLKEGWDVTNLYTIVPLRAANSVGLVEQTIGRGLRLPYGRRVSRHKVGKVDEAGEESDEQLVDTLNIISHDRFQEIVDYARSPDSVIKKQYLIKPGEADKPTVVVEVRTRTEEAIAMNAPPPAAKSSDEWKVIQRSDDTKKASLATFEAIREMNPTQASGSFEEAIAQPTIHAQIVKKVLAKVPDMKPEEAQEVVAATFRLHEFDRIDVPKVRFDYSQLIQEEIKPFKLDLTAINPEPPTDTVLKQYLESEGRVKSQSVFVTERTEARLEDYIIHELVLLDEINYDTQADLLYDLCGQVVKSVEARMGGDKAKNAIAYNSHALAGQVHAQMQKHVRTRPGEPKAMVVRGFQIIHQKAYGAVGGTKPVDFRQPVAVKSDIRGMLFGGFKSNLFGVTKFDSDPERQMAVVIENDTKTIKWFRPTKADLQIEYRADDHYTPDFIVETKTEKFMVEVKAFDEMQDATVQAKAKRACEWVREATAYELSRDKPGKAWSYLLVPDTAINETMTLHGFQKYACANAPIVLSTPKSK
jgi:type III restriction enzyme